MIYLERKICPVCPEKVKCGTLLHPPNLSMHNLKYSTNVVLKKKNTFQNSLLAMFKF